MPDYSKAQKSRKAGNAPPNAELLAHKAIVWWLPILYFLISSLFYLRTYDSAQVKITVMQMGGLALLALWLIRIAETGLDAFSKEDLICLSPFLAYLLVGILSYLHAPYHMASTDFFLRHMFFMIAAIIVIYEFDAGATDWMTRVLIWTAWVAIGYGFWQWVDVMCFPPGIGKGIDPFVWRGAFGPRVFSTYGNPNFFADFLVIIFPILFTQYLKTKKKSLLPLMAMLFVDLKVTDTKGAMMGMAGVVFFLGMIYLSIFKERIAAYRNKLIVIVAVGALGIFGFTMAKLKDHIVSANFRLFTWEGTWEMIMTQPWIGTGIGSYPPIYPAFRRPPIFHIEGKHNTETDHSEDEYLEELFDNGILGFGIFIWLIVSTIFVGLRSLGQLTTTLSLKDGRPPPRAYDLMGYLVAFMGMLAHNFFDVSLRFVSSGVYLGLLSGMVVALCRGQGLYELHGLRQSQTSAGQKQSDEGAAGASSSWHTISEFLLWPARLAAWGYLGFTVYKILTEFNDLQGPLDRINMSGEILQWCLAWGVLILCVAALTWVFVRLIQTSKTVVTSLIIIIAMQPLYLFWGFFKADINHNIAIFLSKERNWDGAIQRYLTVHKLNPDFVMSMYFLGNVFNDRFNMDKIYNPGWGDVNNVARDDYERALDAYNEVRKLAPNYVQMHHQVGNLHMKRAEWAANHGHPEEVQHYLDLAMNRFKLYENIDPVFEPNFLRMGQIYMMEKRYADAIKIYQDFILAPKCQVAPELIKIPWLRESLLSYQDYVNEPGIDYPVHRHETAESYTNLANAYFLFSDQDKPNMASDLEKSEHAYLKALKLDPNFAQAKTNLSALYHKAQTLNLLRKAAPPAALPGPQSLPYTGYEIAPAKP